MILLGKITKDHINHIVDIIGHDHIGIGGDYCGINSTPQGLEDVSKYQNLFNRLQELNPKRWTSKNLKQLGYENIARVFSDVEKVRDKLSFFEPDTDDIPINDLKNEEDAPDIFTCLTNKK